ncbi:MAG: polyprenyl synthetase family protein, partial [Planctomycetes bacterium]|nr:polyprenyl synthetase family protein [Planctomycetota bacterium]
MTQSLKDWLADSSAWAEATMAEAMGHLDLGPETFEQALRYPTFGGGKRLRPTLVRLVCHELGGSDRDAQAPAAAIEWIHTYSLVHDDLPCMDDD